MAGLRAAGFEGACPLHEVAKFGLAIGSWVEVGREFGEALADAAEGDPAAFVVELGYGLADKWRSRTRRLF